MKRTSSADKERPLRNRPRRSRARGNSKWSAVAVQPDDDRCGLLDGGAEIVAVALSWRTLIIDFSFRLVDVKCNAVKSTAASP